MLNVLAVPGKGPSLSALAASAVRALDVAQGCSSPRRAPCRPLRNSACVSAALMLVYGPLSVLHLCLLHTGCLAALTNEVFLEKASYPQHNCP